jgi:hypothetical protein
MRWIRRLLLALLIAFLIGWAIGAKIRGRLEERVRYIGRCEVPASTAAPSPLPIRHPGPGVLQPSQNEEQV